MACRDFPGQHARIDAISMRALTGQQYGIEHKYVGRFPLWSQAAWTQVESIVWKSRRFVRSACGYRAQNENLHIIVRKVLSKSDYTAGHQPTRMPEALRLAWTSYDRFLFRFPPWSSPIAAVWRPCCAAPKHKNTSDDLQGGYRLWQMICVRSGVASPVRPIVASVLWGAAISLRGAVRAEAIRAARSGRSGGPQCD